MKTPVSAYRAITIASSLLLCTVTVEAAQAAAVSPSPIPAVSISADPGIWRRDPFIGSMKKGAVTLPVKTIQLKTAAGVQMQDQYQEIQLQGIMQAGKAFHALINGRTVKTGDRVGGSTINHISRYQVVLLNERKEKVIYDIYQGRIDRGKK